MISKKVLIVDDEEHICSLIEDILTSENFIVISSPDTEDGYKRALLSQPDLIVLDKKIPKIGGIELCRLFRQNPQTKHIPIIMLTVESSETDKVMGLEMGADDYITKPFSSKEFVARIRTLLRRADRTEEVDIIKIDNIEVNVKSHIVTLDSKPVYLRPKEFDLLILFLKKPNVLLSREAILESVFRYTVPIPTRTIDTHIKNLRHALGPFGDRIKTVFGYGFKFECSK